MAVPVDEAGISETNVYEERNGETEWSKKLTNRLM